MVGPPVTLIRGWLLNTRFHVKGEVNELSFTGLDLKRETGKGTNLTGSGYSGSFSTQLLLF